MRHLILLAFAIATLAGCSKSGGGAAASSVVTPGGPALDATPLVYASMTPKVNAAGGTLVTVTGDFDTTNANGKFDDGRWVSTITVTTASGNVCAVTQFTPHQILCTFDASYVGGNIANGLLEVTEDVTITRVLNDGFTETVDAGNVDFKKTAQLAFSRVGGFNIDAGYQAEINAGWYTNSGGPTVLPSNPHITGFTVTNTGAGDATFELEVTGGAVANFESTTCGVPSANGYTATLAPGASCTFQYSVNYFTSVVLGVTHYTFVALTAGATPAGTVYENNVAVVTYDDNLGNTVHTHQDVNFLYSN